MPMTANEYNAAVAIVAVTILVVLIGVILIYNLLKRQGPMWGDENLALEEHPELEDDEETLQSVSQTLVGKEGSVDSGDRKKPVLLESIAGDTKLKTKSVAGSVAVGLKGIAETLLSASKRKPLSPAAKLQSAVGPPVIATKTSIQLSAKGRSGPPSLTKKVPTKVSALGKKSLGKVAMKHLAKTTRK